MEVCVGANSVKSLDSFDEHSPSVITSLYHRYSADIHSECALPWVSVSSTVKGNQTIQLVSFIFLNVLLLYTHNRVSPTMDKMAPR